MATDPPPDLELAPLNGPPRTVQEWLTTFHLVFVAIDPYTNESAWLLPTASRVLLAFREADCRIAWLVAGDPEASRAFLGPLARDILTFSDPDLNAIRGFGLERLPALVHLGIDGTILGSAEGWDPARWRAVAVNLAKIMSWLPPVIPTAEDPGPFEGSPAVPQTSA